MSDSQRAARGRRNGRRAGHAVVIVVAVVFIAASAVQIIPAVFHVGVRPVASSPRSRSPEDACARGLRSLAAALDRAGAQAWSAPTVAAKDDSLRAFRQALIPEWNDAESIRQGCDGARDGPEAWAALARLKRAEEEVLLRAVDDLEPLRRDVAAHVPTDLR